MKSIGVINRSANSWTEAIRIGQCEFLFNQNSQTKSEITIEIDDSIPLTTPIRLEDLGRLSTNTPRLFIIEDGNNVATGFKNSKRVNLQKDRSGNYQELRVGDLVLLPAQLVFEKHAQICVHLLGLGVGLITSSKEPAGWGFESCEDYFLLNEGKSVDGQIADLLSFSFLRTPVIFRGYQKVVESYSLQSFLFSKYMFSQLMRNADPKGS